MPSLGGQGQSKEWTPIKQDILRLILKQHMATVRGIWRKYHMYNEMYLYIDAYAGCGYNDDADCLGSPAIFVEECANLNIPFQAYFIEEDEARACRLRSTIPDTREYHVICDDNIKAVPNIIHALKEEQEYGLLYLDPTGVPDLLLLSSISKLRNFRKVDILIHYSGGAVKRGEGRKKKQGKAWNTLFDFLSVSGKKYWAVRELGNRNNWQRTFLLGMNWRGLNLMKGFHYMDSPKGRHIIERLNYTVPELSQKGTQWNTYHQRTLF